MANYLYVRNGKSNNSMMRKQEAKPMHALKTEPKIISQNKMQLD